MEGIGSRLGRGFRYGTGPAPSAPVFNGPVRKWKRKWVPSQPTDNASSVKGNHHHQETPSLLLCRWTPLPSSNSADSSEPSKRKFRYTPVIVLEEKKKEAVKKINDEAEARKMNRSMTGVTPKSEMNFEEPLFDDDSMEEIEEPSEDEAYFEGLDLQLCLEKP